MFLRSIFAKTIGGISGFTRAIYSISRKMKSSQSISEDTMFFFVIEELTTITCKHVEIIKDLLRSFHLKFYET